MNGTINVNRLGVAFILLASTLGYVIKYYFGLFIGTFLVDFLAVLLFFNFIFYSENKIISLGKIDKSLYTLIGYLFFNFLFFSAIAFVQNRFNIADITDYRNFFRGLLLYLIVRNEMRKDYEHSMMFFVRLLILYSVILYSDAIAEYVLNKIFNIDITFLPWHPSNFEKNAVDYTFGIADSKARIITLFGWPHLLAMIANSLYFFWLWMYKREKKQLYSILQILSAVCLFICESRLQMILFVILNIFFYQSIFSLRITFVKPLIFIGLLFLGYLFYQKYSIYFILASENDFDVFYGQLGVFNLAGIRSFITVPTDIITILFGVGTFGGSKVWGQVWDIAKIEASIVTEVLPKYGVVFFVLYWKLFRKIYKLAKSNNNIILFFAFLPFLIAVLHYWLINKTGVSDYFFIILAIVVALLEGVGLQQVNGRNNNIRELAS